ncbi:MAG: Ni/Fe hydrogenase subunit alpha [Candidatus Micrarchaeales archaeon]
MILINCFYFFIFLFFFISLHIIEGPEIKRVEGSATLEIQIEKDIVKSAKLKVKESKRFFTQGVRGKNFESVPSFLSRICGTCSIAHMMASTEAIEKAFCIENSEQTINLRKLLMNGLMIRDHALHLYFFSLPDIFKKDSLLEIEDVDLIKDCFDVKEAGNQICKVVGGRAVHPTNITIGGFLKIPKEEELKNVLKILKNTREKVLKLIQIFYSQSENFERETIYIAIVGNYDFLEGKIKSTNGIEVEEKDFGEFMERVIIPYSQATAFRFYGKTFMVGALARMNLAKETLNKETKDYASEFLKVFPSNNVFHNNLAQAIEILHCIDSSIEIIEKEEFKEEKPKSFFVKDAIGYGVVEAPRGTLYHKLLIKNGKVIDANFIIPTAQNHVQMEEDIKILVQRLINENKNEHEIIHEVEKLIRAYDPCFSCATHFLKLKLKKL